MTRLLNGFVAAVVLTACDPTEYVYATNRTNVQVVLFEFDRNPRYQQTVAPGQTVRNTWMYPIHADDPRRARVEADDPDGIRVFCHDFSYAELKALQWRIEIQTGRIDCAPGSTPPPRLP
jgi:hypothetical protein